MKEDTKRTDTKGEKLSKPKEEKPVYVEDLGNDTAVVEETVEPSVPADETKLDKKKPDVKASRQPLPFEREVTKILLEDDDEITSAIEQLDGVKTKRVVIAIPEGSDLLMSSVCMRLIAQKADDLSKLVVIVTNDTAGINMANLAGLGTASSTSDIDEESWAQASQGVIQRKSEQSRHADAMKELGATDDDGMGLVNKDFQDNLEAAEDREELGSGAVEHTGADLNETDTDDTQPEEPMDLGRPREQNTPVAGLASAPVVTSTASGVQKDTSDSQVRTISDGDFEMTIDDGGSGMPPMRKPVGKVAVPSSKDQGQQSGLIGRDFSGYGIPGKIGADMKATERVSTGRASGDGNVRHPAKKSAGVSGVTAGVSGIVSRIPKLPFAGILTGIGKGAVKRVLIGAGVILLAVAAFGYWYLPRAVVEIDIESIAVNYEGDVTAKVSVDELDEDELLIPARTEEETNNGSGTGTATGTAVKGEKATGTVNIYNNTFEEVSLPAGTLLSNGGLMFVLDGSVTVPPKPDDVGMGSVSAGVTAQEVGEEYNLASGTTFTIGSLPLSEMKGTNPSKFTGGTKEEYSVVSQADIDKVAEEIKTGLFSESRIALTEAMKDTKWTFVEQSVKEELDGDITSDVPAGSEQTSVNVDVKTKSTALYYDSESLDELIQTMLTKDLGDEKLENVELSDTMTREVTVSSASVDEGTVVLHVKVSGFIMPVLDENKIERDLYGKAWAEGLAYLKKVEYVTGDPDMKFYPEWFPSFLHRMPSRKGQIQVNVNNVAPEDGGEEDSGDDSENTEPAETP